MSKSWTNLGLERWSVKFGETRGVEERAGRPSRYWALQAPAAGLSSQSKPRHGCEGGGRAAGDRENLELILDVLEYLPDHVTLVACFDHQNDFQLTAALA